MAARLAPALRAKISLHAWLRSAQGWTSQQIADDVHDVFDHPITEKAIDRLLKEQVAAFTQLHEGQVEDARLNLQLEQRGIMAAALDGFNSDAASHKDRTQYLRVAAAASKTIADAYGVFVQQIDLTSKGERLVREYHGIDMTFITQEKPMQEKTRT